MSKRTIQMVNPKAFMNMLDMPRGCFLAKDGDKWVALDNSTYNFWVEEYTPKDQAIRWLQGDIEVGEVAKAGDYIDSPEMLVEVSALQGLKLNGDEAGMVLGYFEGHEYSLMAGDGGATMRHDDQYDNNHRGDIPYSIRDAIEFCWEQNEDLVMGGGIPVDESGKEYLASLLRDKQIIEQLMERA